MKQIVDKLNKIAKKIDESVEIPQTDLIIDSLDAITKAYGGTPNDSNLIVDKLEDIYNNIGLAPSGNIEITENGENINVAPYATATVNVSGGSSPRAFKMINAFSLTSPIPLNTPIDISEHLGMVTPQNGSFPVTMTVNGHTSPHQFIYDENTGFFTDGTRKFDINFNDAALYVRLDTAPTSISFRDANVAFTGGITTVDGGTNGILIPDVKESLQHTNKYAYFIKPNTTAEIVIPAIEAGGMK